MKKLIIVLILLLLFSIAASAELSDGAKSNIEILKAKHINEEVESIRELIEKLRIKLYTLSAPISIDDETYPDGISINFPIIEVIDIPLNVLMQVKGWAIWINNKCYYVLLVEKED